MNGMQVQMSTLQQSVRDLQHQSLWMEYLHQRNELTGHHHQLAIEYAQNYGILPLYRGPTEIMPAQQDPARMQPATIVATHQATAVANAAPTILNPPPPTPTPQQFEVCYAPRILNAYEVQQMETVYYQEPTTQAMPQHAVVTTPEVAADDFSLNELLNMPSEWHNGWGNHNTREKYRQN